MKKIIALFLALALVLCMTAAVAEVRYFQLNGVADAEGNVVVSDEFPVLVFGLNDETMECGFGTADELVAGTAVIAGVEENVVVLNVTLEDGTEMVIYYVGDDDYCSFVDEDGLVYTLARVEMAE